MEQEEPGLHILSKGYYIQKHSILYGTSTEAKPPIMGTTPTKDQHDLVVLKIK